MSKFSVGDKVVALSNPNHPNCQPRIKGKIYTVNAVMFCSTDGHQLVNLGLPSEYTLLRCSCGKKHPNDGLMWTFSKEFAKVDDVDEALENAVVSEDYELAVVLRDLGLQNT
jgi:hypothetical protein